MFNITISDEVELGSASGKEERTSVPSNTRIEVGCAVAKNMGLVIAPKTSWTQKTYSFHEITTNAHPKPVGEAMVSIGSVARIRPGFVLYYLAIANAATKIGKIAATRID
jgi:hypothetical protein